MKTVTTLLCLASLSGGLLCACDEAVTPPRLYRAEDGQMKDREGHVLLLRGMNLSGTAKTAEDHLMDLTADDVDRLLGSGVNVARLLTFWKAITPEQGQVDAAYLTAYQERVTRLTDAGLYVVVDMHQDVWGVPFASHGAPDWACPPELTEGYEPQSPWWLNYTTRQVRACFDHFWATPELQAAFTQAWVAVAAQVCSDERVLGFDLFNEPYPGTALFEPEWDNDVLLPFYLQLMDALEAVCPGRLYFLEPSAAYVLGLATPMRLPEAVRDRAVFAGHFYPTEVHEPGAEGYSGDATALEERVLDVFGFYLDDGVPVWNGEWGGITTNPNFEAYVRDVNTLFARHHISATLWDYYRSDGGFAFLDEDGQRKPVFDAVYGSPMPTRLPSPPAVEPDYGARQITLTFACVPGREVTLLLPAQGCDCTAAPSGALAGPLAGAGFVTTACATAQEVQLVCGCPP